MPGWLLLGLLAACEAAEPPAPPAAAGEPEPMSVLVAERWARSCALCHVDGTAGAPRVGNADEWRPRLAQGRDVLLAHTVEGLNNMPPLGYCMACEAEDFEAMIDFMVGGVEPTGGAQ